MAERRMFAKTIVTSDAYVKNHYETILKWYEEDRKVKP